MTRKTGSRSCSTGWRQNLARGGLFPGKRRIANRLGTGTRARLPRAL